MMELEPQEEMDDALWLLGMTARLLRHYDGGKRWAPNNHADAKITPYRLQWEYQLATEQRGTPTPTVNLYAVLLNGYMEDAEDNNEVWKEVKLRIEATRDAMKQHINEQGTLSEARVQGGAMRG